MTALRDASDDARERYPIPGAPLQTAAARRAAAATGSRPSSSIDSNSGGETRRPVTATRTGAKATFGLESEPVDQRRPQRRPRSPAPSSPASASSAAQGRVEHRLRRPRRGSSPPRRRRP